MNSIAIKTFVFFQKDAKFKKIHLNQTMPMLYWVKILRVFFVLRCACAFWKNIWKI